MQPAINAEECTYPLCDINLDIFISKKSDVMNSNSPQGLGSTSFDSVIICDTAKESTSILGKRCVDQYKDEEDELQQQIANQNLKRRRTVGYNVDSNVSFPLPDMQSVPSGDISTCMKWDPDDHMSSFRLYKQDIESLPDSTCMMLQFSKSSESKDTGSPNTITVKELKSLLNDSWIEGEVLNAYFYLLCKQTDNQQQYSKKLAFLSTFFSEILTSRGPSAVNKWNSTKSVIEQFTQKEVDYLLIPCLLRANHWVLAVIGHAGFAVLLDSLATPKGKIKKLKNCLEKWLRTVMPTRVWNVGIAFVKPVQRDTFNCGVFVCKWAEFLAKGKNIFSLMEESDQFGGDQNVIMKEREIILCRVIEGMGLVNQIDCCKRKILSVSIP